MDKTTLFDVATFKSEVITKTLKEVHKSLEERGYNPINTTSIKSLFINNTLTYSPN